MMDRATYDQFREYAVQGKNNPVDQLKHLSPNEAELYAFIKDQPGQNRLEQEKIPHAYADTQFRMLIP
jgi:hypothetical protein